ncbi:MAG: hypothetical protein HZB26_14575 [Candidatus Hydrogenedentes bacterium]|nr:hypothetical protein [Candidatus Hydrogenedentota bacterium]
MLTVHAVRCYADMAGFGRVCALAERLEDDMCNARNAGAPVNPIWLEGVERQLEAIRSCLDEGSDPRAAESVAAPQH